MAIFSVAENSVIVKKKSFSSPHPELSAIMFVVSLGLSHQLCRTSDGLDFFNKPISPNTFTASRFISFNHLWDVLLLTPIKSCTVTQS